jgi:hypothetical protein
MKTVPEPGRIWDEPKFGILGFSSNTKKTNKLLKIF